MKNTSRPAKYLVSLLALLVLLAATQASLACTGLYVGKEVSEDGSTIIARSEDMHPRAAFKRFLVIDRVENEPGRTYDSPNGFSYPLPATTYKYTSVPEAACMEIGTFPAACANEYGVCVTATVTGYICAAAKDADPPVEKGNGEAVLAGLIAATCKTAREGVELIAELMETYGSCEQNIVMIADQKEAWYVEMYTGHQWAAVKMPDDKVAVYGNEFMLDTIDPKSDDVMYSPDLFSLPEKAGFAVYKEDGQLDLFRTYAGGLADYANRRTWAGHHLLAPSTAGEYATETKYDLFYSPDKNVSISDVMALFRYRFEGTDFCPDETGKDDVRVIATETTAEAHIIQVYDKLPAEVSAVTWLCMANAEHAVYLPISSLVTGASEAFTKDVLTYGYDDTAASCIFKQLCTLSEQDRKLFGQGVRDYWHFVEQRLIAEFPSVIEQTAKIYETSREEAAAYATNYCVTLQEEALNDAKRLFKDLLWYMMGTTDTLKHKFDYDTLTMSKDPVIVAPFEAAVDIKKAGESLGYAVSLRDNELLFEKDGKTVTASVAAVSSIVAGETTYKDAVASAYVLDGVLYMPLSFLKSLQ